MGSRAVERIARGRVPAARAVRRGRGPDGAPGAARRVPGDQQLLHGDRVRKGRRGHPHAAHAARRRSASAAAWTCTSSATTGRRSPATISCRRCRTRPASTSTQFRRWYAQAGTPVVERRAAATTPRARTYTLDVAQHTAADAGPAGRSCRSTFRSPSGWSAPTAATCRLRLDGEAAPRPARRACSTCASSAQSFRFVDVAAHAGAVAAARLLGAGASSTSTTPTTSSPSSPRTTAIRSTAGTRRSAASPTRCCALARDHREGTALALPPSLVALAGHLLADRDSDPALLALALTLPDPGYVAALETDDRRRRRHRRARVPACARSAPRHRAALRGARHARIARGERLRADAGADRRRASCANVCLRYLGALDDPPRARAARSRNTTRADNMTDAIAALAALKDSDVARARATCSRASRRRGATSRWCSTSGSRWRRERCAPTRSRGCKALLAHPRFNARNPNRVRSLVGAFALRNFARFHAADGAGYAFAPTRCCRSTRRIPQLAATDRRRVQPVEALPATAARPDGGGAAAASPRHPDLSPDVSEIVTRSLGVALQSFARRSAVSYGIRPSARTIRSTHDPTNRFRA